MKNNLLLTTLISVITLPGFSQTYIKNVSLLDVTNQRVISGQTVIISGDLISRICNQPVKIRRHAKVIDGKGKFLMPGMTDAHIHLFQTGGLYTRPDLLDVQKYRSYATDIAWGHQHMEDILRRYTKAGITTVIDAGSTFHYLTQRDSFRHKNYAPTIYMAGPLISPYEPLAFRALYNDEPCNLFTTASEAVEKVREQLPYKPDLIKIWYIITGKNKEEEARKYQPMVKAIIFEAHKNHLRVAVHATERIAAQLAVESGCDYLVHGVDDEVLSDDFIVLLKKNHVVVCPTLTVLDDLYQTFGQNRNFSSYELTHANPEQLGSIADLKHLPDSALIRQYKILGNTTSRFEIADSIRRLNLRKMVAAGITIAAGTDAGTMGTEHASSFFTELLAMQASGMSNWQIIQSATIGGARAIGKEKESGSIAPGKRADMILLSGNPVGALENLQKICLIIHKGVLISPDTLVKNTPQLIVQQQVNAINFYNIEAFLATYAPDVEIYHYPNRLAGKGKDYLRSTMTGLFSTGNKLHCEILRRSIKADVITDLERLSGLKTGTADQVVRYHISNSKIDKIYLMKTQSNTD